MKRLFTFVLLLAISIPMLAERIDQQKATKVAETVLPNKELSLLSMQQFDNLYVFNSENGFVMVAAYDCARPVLAYSNDFPFKTDNMPENLQGWLSALNAEIQDAVDRQLEASNETRREWDLLLQGNMPEPKCRSGVKPLIKTHWDQYEPYDNLCPGGSLAGCVAIAMAQVMKYWEWPHRGTGSHSYTHPTYGQLSVNYGNTTYDWDNMVNMMYADSPMAQQTAVSTLVYHCGVSVDMDYDPDGSAAFSDQVIGAWTSYFDYNQDDIRWLSALDYDAASWISILKTEVDNGRPVYYSGRSEGGGHAFICDGYDVFNKLHFNWGWGGFCDGYYAYGALDPGTGGAGSGSGSYNQLNYIIAGAHPNASMVPTPENLSASTSDRVVTLSWSPVSGISRYKVYRDGFVVNTNVNNNSYTDQNVAYGNHVYAVRAVNSNGDYSQLSEELAVAVTYPGPVPTNLRAAVQGDNVQLSWTAPANESAQLKYGDGEASQSSYGNPEGTGFQWGQRYTPVQLSPYAGMAITSVDFYTWKASDYFLYIYSEEEDHLTTLAAGRFSIPEAGWWTINLDEPLPFDYENNLIVSFYHDCSDYLYMAAYTSDFEGGENASLFMEDDVWYNMDNTISWLICTNITDGTYTYSIYRNDQLIASDLTQTDYVDTDLQSGTYQYTVRTKYYDFLSDPSNVVQVTLGTGADENETKQLAVYPNPAHDKVMVHGEYMESIEVVSLTGQHIRTLEVDNNHAEVDLSKLHPGVYVLMVNTREGVNRIRVIKD